MWALGTSLSRSSVSLWGRSWGPPGPALMLTGGWKLLAFSALSHLKATALVVPGEPALLGEQGVVGPWGESGG